jgi:hypothetical protein
MRSPSRHWRAEENEVEHKPATHGSRWLDAVFAGMIVISLAGLIYDVLQR